MKYMVGEMDNFQKYIPSDLLVKNIDGLTNDFFKFMDEQYFH